MDVIQYASVSSGLQYKHLCLCVSECIHIGKAEKFAEKLSFPVWS
jgi:Na+-translocating ferredoxin:NAD+ oxidoreductase RnfE subunit